ncbi:MAG TPA: hypothetical protein DEF42_10230 [Desulfosporosinus sp.]|nr:hypothetical protein [Desulfosporosinus sp.]
MKRNLAELMLMSSMMQPYGSSNLLPMPAGRIINDGLPGKEHAKRKARNKMARKSRKRNRK